MGTEESDRQRILPDLVNKLNVGIYRNNPGKEGTFVYCNDAVERIFGYSRSELYQLPVSKLYQSVADRREFEEEIRSNGSIRGKRLNLKNKKGESIYVEVNATAINDPNTNEILYYDGVVMDVSDEVEMYENISHQISTPIVGILHSAQRLIDRTAGDEKSILLSKSIISSSRLALFLTRNLDYMSKIIDMSEEGFSKILILQDLAPTTINLIIDLQEYALQEKGVHINANSKSLNSLPAVLLDIKSFEMVAFCILENAIKYSFENTTINVSGFISGRYVSINIEDEGIPLEAKYLPPNQPNVFMKNYRTPESKAFVSAGYGLGLYLARRIMKLHGGDIILEPTKNYKTSVRLAFPK